MSEKPYNEDRLSERFHNAIENSRDDRIQDSYGFDRVRADRIAEEAERIPDLLLKGATDGVSDTTVRQAQSELEKLCCSPEDDRLAEFVGRVIDEKIGEEIVRRQAVAEKRFLLLVQMGQEALIDSRTRDYLHLATQCFLFGFDEQSAVMCRSSLEAAFMHVVPDAICAEHLSKSPRQGQTKVEYSLTDRFTAAVDAAIIDGALAKVARYVNRRANEVIHPDRNKRTSIGSAESKKTLFATIHVVHVLMGEATPKAKSG